MKSIGLFLKNNHKNMKQAIVPTMVVTCIFFVNYFFFGMDNTIIGPCLTLSYLYFRDMSNSFCSMIKTLLIYEIMAVSAWAAGMNLGLCIAINAAIFFWNVYFRADDHHLSNYYTPGMMFILFQLFPASGMSAVFVRIEALGASFAVTGIFLLLVQNRAKKHSIRDNIIGGFEICENLLSAYEEQDQERITMYQEQLRSTSETICDEIYLHNYSVFGAKSKANWYCKFVALFQSFIVLTAGPCDYEKIPIMENLCRNFKTLFMKGGTYECRQKLAFQKGRANIRSMSMRFALQQVIALTPCMVFAYLCPVGNGFWLPVSVYFMLVPFCESTHKRVGGRLFGTVVGIIMCAILYSIFPGLNAHIVLLLIFNFLINSATRYEISVAYITCAILALGITPANMGAALSERLIYTLIGAVITIIVSKYVFPFEKKTEMDYVYEHLISLQNKMFEINELEKNNYEVRQQEKNQLLIQSYVLSRRLRLYNESLPENERNQELLNLLNEHMMQMSYFIAHHFIGVRAKTDIYPDSKLCEVHQADSYAFRPV